MHDSFGQYDDLLQVAGAYARDSVSLRSDVAAMIFPRAFTPPSEALIADISNKFSQLIADIEQEISREGAAVSSALPALLQSGLQRDPALLDFLLARNAEQQLEMRLAKNSDISLSETLPAVLLASADHNIAEAAQTLLAISSLNRRKASLKWRSLPPELLHRLCWRIVSALDTGDKEAERQKVQDLLSSYSENQTAANAARKLTHMLGDEHQADKQSAAKAGLALFVAGLADVTFLSQDQICRLLDLPSISPFAVIQRAAEFRAEAAMENIRSLFGFDQLTPRDINLFESGFNSLSIEDAKAAVSMWHSESNLQAGGSV